jgi:hypothetical protein
MCVCDIRFIYILLSVNVCVCVCSFSHISMPAKEEHKHIKTDEKPFILLRHINFCQKFFTKAVIRFFVTYISESKLIV